MKVYLKTWCPWCIEAINWLQERGYEFETIDVEESRENYQEMITLSGQRLTPTLVLEDDSLLADFDVDQLESFLKRHNVTPPQ